MTRLTHAILIAAVCLVAYSNTFRVPFQFDDKYQIAAKPFVRDVRAFIDPSKAKLYGTDHAFRVRTVGYLTFALNYRLHGEDVTGYHVVNLAVHLLNALLVYWLVVLTFRTPGLKGSPLVEYSGRVALFSALLFAGHPLQTEAVTYIVQRIASLATLFCLLGVTLYSRCRIASMENSAISRSLPWYLLSLLSAVLAMRTKEIAFTLPVTIALYEVLFFKGSTGKRALILLPFIFTMMIIPLRILGAGGTAGEWIGDVSQATRVGTALSRPEYLFTQSRVVVTYLRLLCFPVGQNLDYDYPVFASFGNPEVFLSFLFLVSLFAFAVYLLYRERGKPSAVRLVSFGVFWFFITLSVESSVIPISDVIFEHRVYLPSAGFFVAVATLAFMGVQGLKRRRRAYDTAAVAALTAAIIVLTGASYARNDIWRSESSLWEDVMKKSPRKARAYRQFGSMYWESGQYDRSIAYFSKAIALSPLYTAAYNGLGVVYGRLGRLDKAAETLETAIRLDPRFPEAEVNLGIVYSMANRIDEAILHFRRALWIDPRMVEARVDLAIVYNRKGLLDLAAEEYRTALELQPGNADVRNNLGIVYGRKGEIDKAIGEFQAALRLKPDDPDVHENLARAYEMKRLPDRAEEHRRTAQRLRGR